jgi:hypothetical protein
MQQDFSEKGDRSQRQIRLSILQKNHDWRGRRRASRMLKGELYGPSRIETVAVLLLLTL